MENIKQTIDQGVQELGCEDDSGTITDYIFGIVADNDTSDSDKKESLFEFMTSITAATEQHCNELIEKLIVLFNDTKKQKQQEEKELLEIIKKQQELKIKQVTSEEIIIDDESSSNRLSKEEQRRRDLIISRYDETEELDENGDIIYTDNTDKKKEELTKTVSSLGANVNTKRIVDAEKEKRERSKVDHQKKVQRDKDALAKQKKDEEKKKTTKKEKRRL
ncbi:hypothetical protein DFA_06588 [Cavenderia fasciculata]|uniref:Coiled-coil domain-containing protein 43 n=1 Tax=Cavenderia fasciculata TaxID=261658 RepID=F4PJF2_CACFS|nr:uncharacterized protein DFA_06588 [Cavenderia fasciculata]EGG24438.1 hypothetical protein DFA_06588 [Cavenderia fasciculata]|eukprot:XP_004362289.1 hypothetical protein DFA_06588 [Cavenderia fasciculata]